MADEQLEFEGIDTSVIEENENGVVRKIRDGEAGGSVNDEDEIEIGTIVDEVVVERYYLGDDLPLGIRVRGDVDPEEALLLLELGKAKVSDVILGTIDQIEREVRSGLLADQAEDGYIQEIDEDDEDD